MKISLFFILMLHSLLSFSGNCPTATSGCSKITSQTACGSYYIKTGCTENTTNTHCTNCSVCISGKSDCVKGAAGCKSCNIKNGHHTCTGTACSWGTYCSDGGGPISCSLD